MKLKKKLRRFAARMMVYLSIFLLKTIPAKFMIEIARPLSTLLKNLFRRETEIARKNMERVYGNGQHEELIKGFYIHLLYGVIEVMKADRFPEGFDFQLQVEKAEMLDNLIRKGKKILWISAHLGNWELLPFYFSMKGYRISVMARRLYDERLNGMLERFRKRGGINVIYSGEGAGYQILRAIKRDHIIGFLIDQGIRELECIESSFLGVPSFTPSGFARLAIRFSMPLVVGVNVREAPFRFRILISEPIFPDGKEEREIVDTVNGILSEYIFSHPEQWMWIHRRWE